MMMEKGRKGKRILAKEACLLPLMYILDNIAPGWTPEAKLNGAFITCL